MIFVTVASPVGRDIYLNGEYGEPVGTAPEPLPLNPGTHLLETLTLVDGSPAVDFEGWVFNLPNLASTILNLEPVVPPRPVQLPFGVALGGPSPTPPGV